MTHSSPTRTCEGRTRNATKLSIIAKVFKFLVEECLPSDEEWTDSFSGNSLALFMIEASCENSAVSVIYHLLKRNVHDAFSGNDNGVSKKRKCCSSS
jgi:hypothetical protein